MTDTVTIPFHDASATKARLGQLPGILSVADVPGEKKLTVEYDPGSVALKLIFKAGKKPYRDYNNFKN